MRVNVGVSINSITYSIRLWRTVKAFTKENAAGHPVVQHRHALLVKAPDRATLSLVFDNHDVAPYLFV